VEVAAQNLNNWACSFADVIPAKKGIKKRIAQMLNAFRAIR
jgi:hypothetical protein